MDQAPTAIGDLDAVEARDETICRTPQTGSGQRPCRYRGEQRPRSVVVGKQSGPRYRAAQRLLCLAWDSVFDRTPVAQPTESPYTDPYVR